MLQSIARYLILSLLAYLVGHHVITQQIADVNAASMVNYAVIILSVVITVAWSYFEKKAKGVLPAYFPSTPSGSPPPATRLLVLVLVPFAAGMSLVGCAGSGGTTTTPTASTLATALDNALTEAESLATDAVSWAASNPTTIQAAGTSCGNLYLGLAVQHNTTKQALAVDVNALAMYLYSVDTGSTFNTSTLTTDIQSWGGSGASGYEAELASLAVAPLNAVMGILPSGGKALFTVITNFAIGLQNSALPYLPSGTPALAPVPATTNP